MSGRWPTFFVAGAPKCGTTALYQFLRQHPQVYLSPIKEPTFFAAADLLNGPLREAALAKLRSEVELERYLAGPLNPAREPWVFDERQYLALFEGAGDRTAIGEMSTTYFWQPHTPAAIAARVPDARIVLMLRDPGERTFSGYLSSLYNEPDMTFGEYFPHGRSDEEPPVVAVGRYATNLRRFLAVFPASQVRVYLYEDFRARPLEVLRDLFVFLGVDPGVPVDVRARHNEPVIPRFARLHRLRQHLLPADLRSRLHGPLGSLAAKLYHKPRRNVRMDPAHRAAVIERFRDEIEATASLLGRDLSAWLR